MPTGKRDFILLDYTAKVKETGETFDTNIADAAKKANIFKEDAAYDPMLVVVGEGWVLRGLDEQLTGLEVGEKRTVEIPPQKAFGMRDPTKIKLVPLRRFRDQKVAPYPGMEVEVDGKIAVVRSVGAGRVQVDFNPPLAGRTLVYEVEVKQVLQDNLDKIKALIHRRIPTVDVGKFEVDLKEKTVNINMPEEAFALDRLQLAKRGIAADIPRFFSEVEEVVFVEKYVRKVKPKPATEKPPQPQKEEAKPESAASRPSGT